MEYDIIKNANQIFDRGENICSIEKLVHKRTTSEKKSGLICSGSQTNFTHTLNEKDLKTVRRILTALKKNQPGKIKFSNKGISFKQSKTNFNDSIFKYKNNNDFTFEESIGAKQIVHIFGAGHVGIAVSKVMSMLNFHVVIYDDRKGFMLKDNFADEKIIDSFSGMGKYISGNQNEYVVIVTTGYLSDKEVLKQVIKKNVRYIGLMGTKTKIKKVFNEAVKDGISKKQLEKIHAPIGIDINSDTPDEIAISIAAELIKIKNEI
jgi:xanthine dehydrogenase accessory factor